MFDMGFSLCLGGVLGVFLVGKLGYFYVLKFINVNICELRV